MLVLSRKAGETLFIGHDVEVTIAGIDGNRVRLAINAPKSVPIYRKEVYKKVKNGKAKSSPGNTAPAVDPGRSEHHRPATGSTGGTLEPHRDNAERNQ